MSQKQSSSKFLLGLSGCGFKQSRLAFVGGRRLCLTLMVFFLGLGISQGQSKAKLVEQRQELQEQIQQTNKMLEKAQKNRETALSQLIQLQNNVQSRQALINNLNREIELTDRNIERTEVVINALNGDLNSLTEEYTNMVRLAFRLKLNQSFLQFILSSANLSDAWSRWQYIRQYEDFRSRQTQLIEATQATLELKKGNLVSQKEQRQTLLAEAKNEQRKLQNDLNQKDVLVRNLKSEETKLVRTLDQQQADQAQLNATIAEAIRIEEAKIAKAAAEKVAATNKKASVMGFSSSKGKLPWPVKQGTITKGFGTLPHPTLKGLKIINNGIDITSSGTNSVTAVFDGKVISSNVVPGYQYTVIVQHDEFYTVYSNLNRVMVNRGQEINAGTPIGKLGEGRIVHFEIWKGKERLNPAQWIKK